MKVHLNKVHFPVTVLGPGRRLGIWFQGCSIHCQGCLSRDTWEFTAESKLPVAALLNLCRNLTGCQCPDGFTISGGEPFCQPEALHELLLGLHAWRQISNAEADILCYSGFPASVLQQDYPELLALLDVLIPEPFVEAGGDGLALRGSDNQPLLVLTPLGEKRFASLMTAPREDRMQVLADGNRLWHIGIPYREALIRYENLCRKRGLIMEDLSWRA